jgi:alcohol dehydrogenase
MRAARIAQYGDVSVVAVEKDIPRPQAGPGKVLVEVHAAGLNPADSAIRNGYMHQAAPLAFPATLGIDFAGVVVTADPSGGGLAAGDRVFGTASALSGGSGTFADFAAVPSTTVAKLPGRLSFAEAAALPLAGISALQALETMKVGEGSRVFINGGAGGIGSFGIQIAKALGAHVAVSCRGPAAGYVKSLGADEVVDFETTPLPGALRDFDAVLDTAGGDSYKAAFGVLRGGGTIITLAAMPDAELASKHGVTAQGQTTQATTERLDRLAALVAAGKIMIHVARSFTLDGIKDAFAAREAGKVNGKIVLKIRT